MELSQYLLDRGTAESVSLRNVLREWYVVLLMSIILSGMSVSV